MVTNREREGAVCRTHNSTPGAEGAVDWLQRWHSVWNSRCRRGDHLINLIRPSAVLVSNAQVQLLLNGGVAATTTLRLSRACWGWPARGGCIWSTVVMGGSSSVSFFWDSPALIVWAENPKWLLLHFTLHIPHTKAFRGAPKPETLLGALGGMVQPRWNVWKLFGVNYRYATCSMCLQMLAFESLTSCLCATVFPLCRWGSWSSGRERSLSRLHREWKAGLPIQLHPAPQTALSTPLRLARGGCVQLMLFERTSRGTRIQY